jgi:hypothetical protein
VAVAQAGRFARRRAQPLRWCNLKKPGHILTLLARPKVAAASPLADTPAAAKTDRWSAIISSLPLWLNHDVSLGASRDGLISLNTAL